MKRLLTIELLLLLVLLIAINNYQKQPDVIQADERKLQILKIDGLALSPIFEITDKHYVSTAAYSVRKINLRARAKQPDAELTINGLTFNESIIFNLAVGNNGFTIKIKDNKGVTDKYQLTVTRLPKITRL